MENPGLILSENGDEIFDPNNPYDRIKENLDGKLWSDYFLSCCCPCCVLIQMHRQEAHKHRLEKLAELKLPSDAKIPKEDSPTFDFIFEHTYCPKIVFFIGAGFYKMFCCWLNC